MPARQARPAAGRVPARGRRRCQAARPEPRVPKRPQSGSTTTTGGRPSGSGRIGVVAGSGCRPRSAEDRHPRREVTGSGSQRDRGAESGRCRPGRAHPRLHPLLQRARRHGRPQARTHRVHDRPDVGVVRERPVRSLREVHPGQPRAAGRQPDRQHLLRQLRELPDEGRRHQSRGGQRRPGRPLAEELSASLHDRIAVCRSSGDRAAARSDEDGLAHPHHQARRHRRGLPGQHSRLRQDGRARRAIVGAHARASGRGLRCRVQRRGHLLRPGRISGAAVQQRRGLAGHVHDVVRGGGGAGLREPGAGPGLLAVVRPEQHRGHVGAGRAVHR